MLVLLLILQGPTKGHQGSVHLCFHRSQNTSLIHALEQIWNVEGAVVCYILGITCAGGGHWFPYICSLTGLAWQSPGTFLCGAGGTG